MITETERYTIVFFGVDSKFYTKEFVAYLWEESANKEFRKSGIFITALISIDRLVCGKIRGCTLGDTAHIITTVRNPVEVRSQEAFWNPRVSLQRNSGIFINEGIAVFYCRFYNIEKTCYFLKPVTSFYRITEQRQPGSTEGEINKEYG